MISPAKLDKLPAEVVNLVVKLQEEIISDVCRRVTKANYLTPTAEWQLYKANQLRLSYNEVNRRIARQLKVRERIVRELYTETVKQALKEDADIYRIAAAMGKLPDNTGAKIGSYFRSAAFSSLLSKGLKNTKGQLRNLCNSMAAEANRALSDSMDLAHLKVISGAYSYNDAIYSAVKELSGKGITKVEYPSGRRDNVDVCVRRAVLSSVNKSCCDIQLDLANEVGSHYVEVTAHIGARPSHAEWQGQIYSLEKGELKYPYFYDATGYGTGEGLGGWNCRHNFFPYFEGIDTPYHTPDFTKTENNEYYALTQKQRGYERAVRDSKRQLAALDGARKSAEDSALREKLDRDFARWSVTLKNRDARLEKFIKDNDLQRDNSRVRVAGFGKSVSQKAIAAAKRLDNVSRSGIIKYVSLPNEALNISSMSQEVYNAIQRAIKNAEEEFGEICSTITITSFGKDHKTEPFRFYPVKKGNWYEASLQINKDYNFNPTLAEYEARIMRNYNSGVLASKSLNDLLLHEYAHIASFSDCEDWRVFTERENLLRISHVKGISGYADAKPLDGSESLAESYVRYKNGEAIPTKAMELLNTYVLSHRKKA